MSQAVDEHRSAGPGTVRLAVLTVSDTRTTTTDTSGALIADLAAAAGHTLVFREIRPDEPEALRGVLREWLSNPEVEAVLITGGTGIAGRDETVDTLLPIFDKQLPGYGELFRMLSFQEIGAAAMLSRAVAGVCGRTVVFLMPGSRAAVKLAMERLILPELAHVVGLLRPERRRPS